MDSANKVATNGENINTGAAFAPVNLAVALDLARQGFRVFPCKPDKSPHTKRGHLDATTDIDTIKCWFSQWPNALVGLPTGDMNGLWVLDGDVDAAKSVDGFEELRRLEVEHGALPIDVCATTPRSGTHIYFRMPTGVELRNSQSKIARGLDVRASGGYVIVASRLPDGRAYRWVNEGLGEADLPDAPEWLLEMATRKGPPPEALLEQDLRATEGVMGPPPRTLLRVIRWQTASGPMRWQPLTGKSLLWPAHRKAHAMADSTLRPIALASMSALEPSRRVKCGLP